MSLTLAFSFEFMFDDLYTVFILVHLQNLNPQANPSGMDYFHTDKQRRLIKISRMKNFSFKETFQIICPEGD